MVPTPPVSWQRQMFAELIDLGVITGFVTLLLEHRNNERASTRRGADGVVVWLAVGVYYILAPRSTHGRTVGRAICGLRLTDVSEGNADLFQLVRRELVAGALWVLAAKILPEPCRTPVRLGFPLIDRAVSAISPSRRGLKDRFARTLMVRTNE